jgi:hypothetical protein
MILALILAAGILWTHAPGWTDPIEVIETPDNNTQHKDLVVTDIDHLHQVWDQFEGESRVGYNIVLPDGSALVPDQMISNDVHSNFPHMAKLGEDSVVIVWMENYQFWFQIRNSEGSVVVPTTIMPIPPSSRIQYDVACDSLRRIHLVDAQFITTYDEFVLYSVHNLDGSVVFQDTIPGNSYYDPDICIDGNRVHIKYEAHEPWRTMYIQYNLDGNVTINPVLLFDDDLKTSHFTSMATDALGDVYLFLYRNPDDGLPEYASLFKLDGETGSILINDQIIFQGEFYYSIANDLPAIEPMPGDESFNLAFIREYGNANLQIEFCLIDADGSFIEDPYVAYDYTDEPIQNLVGLASTVNEGGDVFLTWCEGDTLVGGYFIVLGWLDFDWVGIQDHPVEPDEPGIALSLSSNPFHGFLSIDVTGSEEVPELSVFDITGRRVKTLASEDGRTFLWDGYDSGGNQLPVGAYIILAESLGITVAVKVVKLD